VNTEDRRRYERVETNVMVKLPGDASWTESTTSNVSGGGLLFESTKQLNPDDLAPLQFMLQTGTHANVHFFASARVVRTRPKDNSFQIAVEFIIDEDVRKEISKLVAIIKGQNFMAERPTTSDALFGRSN
jgi:hypothetical protein